jgi:hypothetical protein
LLHYSHDFIERTFAIANEFVLTPAAWLQPASLFTPTPKAAQGVLEFSARKSIEEEYEAKQQGLEEASRPKPALVTVKEAVSRFLNASATRIWPTRFSIS